MNTSIHPSIRFTSITSRTDKIIISLAYSENIVFLKIIKFIIYMWKRNLSTIRYDQANCCVLSTSMLFGVGILHSRRYIYFVKCHISLSSNIPFSNLAHTYIKWGTVTVVHLAELWSLCMLVDFCGIKTTIAPAENHRTSWESRSRNVCIYMFIFLRNII